MSYQDNTVKQLSFNSKIKKRKHANNNRCSLATLKKKFLLFKIRDYNDMTISIRPSNF